MSKSRDSFILTAQTVPELVQQLNFLLQRWNDRIDKIEGIRGTATIESDLNMSDHRVRSVGAGSLDNDGARLGDVPQDDVDFNNVNLTGNLKIYDDDGNLIHSLE